MTFTGSSPINILIWLLVVVVIIVLIVYVITHLLFVAPIAIQDQYNTAQLIVGQLGPL